MPAKSARKRPAPAFRTARKPGKRPLARAVPIAEPRTMSLPFVVADTARGDQLLTVAIAGSILLHTLVLALRFSPFDLAALDPNSSPLEVALVNAKSKSKPTKAEILAQANLDGGGNSEARHRAMRHEVEAGLRRRHQAVGFQR